MGWLIRTILDILPLPARRKIADSCRDEGLIYSTDVGGAAVVTTPSEWLERGGEAWRDIGHDGAKTPTNEPWERR